MRLFLSIHFPPRRTESGQRISDLSEAEAKAYFASLDAATSSHAPPPAPAPVPAPERVTAAEPMTVPERVMAAAERSASAWADLSPNSIVFPADQHPMQAVNPMSAGPKGQAKYVQISPSQMFLSAAEIESIELGGAKP
ncbi:MAG: hypothetical protein WDW36_004679 [Sanguina aurantia]